MDTSAIDVFGEIIDLCGTHSCLLFLSGLSNKMRSNLTYAGIRPYLGSTRFAYAADLESALARAEDGLVTNVFHLEEKDEIETSARSCKRALSNVEDGFLYTLHKINELHDLNVADVLSGFRAFTTPMELEAGDVLVRNLLEDGLYFVKTGLLQVRHASGHSTMNMSRSLVGSAPYG